MTTKAELQAENEQLRALLASIPGLGQQEEKPKSWFKVTNLSPNYVILPHPQDPHNLNRAASFQPYQMQTVDGDLFDQSQQGRYNKDLERKGLISIEETDAFEPFPEADQGRRKAFAEDVKLQDPDLEFLASQILLFAGEDLPTKIVWSADGITVADPGVIVKALIEAEPHRGTGPGNRGPIDYQYLAEIHRPFLQNVLKREKLWRNRPAIVSALETRIDQLSDVVLMKAQQEQQRLAFEREQGGSGIGLQPGSYRSLTLG